MKRRRLPLLLFSTCCLLVSLACGLPVLHAQDDMDSDIDAARQHRLAKDALAVLSGAWRPEADDPRCQLLPKLTQQMRCEEAYWSFFSMLEQDRRLMLDLDDCFIKGIATSGRCESHPNRFQWGWLDGCLYAELTLRDHCIQRFTTPVRAEQDDTPQDPPQDHSQR